MLSRDMLHKYQNHAIDFILNHKKVGLFLPMGMGKSISSLTAITDLSDSLEITKTLVIAPLRVANSTWHVEARNWEHTSHLKFAICTGSEKNRIAKLHEDADVFVINRENIEWLVNFYKNQWPFDCVVIDESSSFKSSSTKRWKALRQIVPFTNYMWLLTGTPSPNGLLDLWSQVYLLDTGQRLGRTMTAYKQRFFESDYMGYKWTPRKGADEQIHDLISDITMSMKVEDYLELPDRIDTYQAVTMTKKHLTMYRKLEKEFFLELEDGSEIESESAGVLAGKLVQFANGAQYTDDSGNWTEIHKGKLDALQDIIDDNPDENILVAYNYKSDLQRLTKRFKDAVVMDKEGKAVEDWNNGCIKLLLAHPACLHPETKVLTEYRGWVNIIDVTPYDRVHDGVEFVSHSGCFYSGYKEVIECFGIKMTPEHKLLIGDDWVEAQNVGSNTRTRREALYTYEGDDDYVSSMFSLWERVENIETKCSEAQQAKQEMSELCETGTTQYDTYSVLGNMASYETTSSLRKRCKLSSLRWSRDWYCRGMVRVQEFLQGYVRNLRRSFNNRKNRCKQGVFEGELSLGNLERTSCEQNYNEKISLSGKRNTLSRTLSNNGFESGNINSAIESGNDSRPSSCKRESINLQEKSEKSKVYDLVDCGPRNRFLIKNDDGEVFISHNSAGHGLNLQKGGSMIVWFGLTWSLEYYQQFNARLHRQGQDKPVRIIHLVTEGCIDEKIVQVIGEKAETQEELLNALKVLTK